MADNARSRYLKYRASIECGHGENLPAPVTEFDKYLYACALDNDDWNDENNAYIVGSTPYAADWLSLTSGGAPLTPETNILYIIVSAGAYTNRLYRWNGTTYTDVSPTLVIGTVPGTAFDGGSGQAIVAFLASGADGQYLKSSSGAAVWGDLDNILFNQTADKTNTCDGTAQSLIGTGVGSTTIPANSLKAGDSLHIIASGILSAASGDSITLTIKLGGITVYTHTADAGAAFSDTPYYDFGDIVIRTDGASGTLKISGTRQIFGAIGFGTITALHMRGSAAIDTTIDNVLTIEYTAPSGATITSENLLILKREV